MGFCAVVLAMGWDAVGGSAGSILRWQGNSGDDQLLRCAQGFLWIASNARFGPIPLPLAGVGVLTRCRRGLAGGGSRFSILA